MNPMPEALNLSPIRFREQWMIIAVEVFSVDNPV